MHIQSLEDARDSLRAGPVAVFSFDVFDITLLRRCTAPDGVFERAFQLAPIPAAKRGMVEAFVQQRQLAEGKARKAGLAAHGSHEVTIEEIYQRFPTAIFGLSRADWPKLAEAEFWAELELCFANSDVIALISDLRASGVRVGFLSDTYWTGPRLARLLKSCAPELGWDFLYASCDHRNGKAEKLFDVALADLGMVPRLMAHMGDNDGADVLPARKRGIRAIAYPQSAPALAAIFQRENALFDLMCADNGASRRLDHGARTARRQVAARAPAGDAAFTFGVRVLGPVMAAFDRFVAARVERLRAEGRKVAVAFLARDGLLPLEVWRALRPDPAAYAEINRRIALIAGALSLEPLEEFFRRVPQVDRAVAGAFLKHETKRLRQYFKRLGGGAVSGRDFAKALPELLSERDLAPIAAALRKALMAHLRAVIAGFDDATDLVLVDLGYSGTVQKALRTVLGAEGVDKRLHGLYLLSADESFHELAEGDTAEGLLSDAVMVPHAKRALLSNVAILEQMCGAPEGSVCDYAADGAVSREADPRPTAQLELCGRIRAGAVHYARALAALPEPQAEPEAAAPWAGAILARALLLPTDDELVLLGALRHDVNLGSQALAPMADAGAAAAIVSAKPLPAACAPHEPPMWMAASLAALSPLHGLLYALNGAGRLPADVVGDLPCGEAELVLIDGRDGHPLKITSQRNGFGELRLRVPLLRNSRIASVAIPASALPARGMIAGITLQWGETTAEAMRSQTVEALPAEAVQALGLSLDRGVFEGVDGHLLVSPPPLPAPVGVLTVTIVPLDGGRVLSLAEEPHG